MTGEEYPSSEGFEITILTARNCTTLEELLAAIRASCVDNSADPVVAARERQFFTTSVRLKSGISKLVI
jgi:hypothetical protein